MGSCKAAPLKSQPPRQGIMCNFPRKGKNITPTLPFLLCNGAGLLHCSLKRQQRFKAHLCLTDNFQKHRDIKKE